MWRHLIPVAVTSSLALLSLLALAQTPALAQTNESGSIDGGGRVVLRPKATLLRVQLDLVEHGDDMAATLATLARRGELFRKAVLAAKAEQHSVKLDGPRLVGQLRAVGELLDVERQWGKGKWNQRPQIAAPQQPPSAPPGTAPPEAKRAPRITVAANLTAEWQLHGKNASELLVEADRIVLEAHQQMGPLLPKERLHRFSRQSPKGQSAPRAQSARQSIDPFDSDSSDEAEAEEADLHAVTGPYYLFVGQVSDADLRNAKTEAFRKAETDAAAHARIARRSIGWLLTLSLMGQGGAGDRDPFGGRASPAPTADAIPCEAVGTDPSSLQIEIEASATFRLLPPG
jgi:hypothetical protein